MAATDRILSMDFVLMERRKRCFSGFPNRILSPVTHSFSRLRLRVCFLHKEVFILFIKDWYLANVCSDEVLYVSCRTRSLHRLVCV